MTDFDKGIEIVGSAREQLAAKVIAKTPKAKRAAPLPATPPEDEVASPWLNMDAILQEIRRDYDFQAQRFILNKWATQVYRGAFEDGAENVGSCCGCSINGKPVNPFTQELLFPEGDVLDG